MFIWQEYYNVNIENKWLKDWRNGNGQDFPSVTILHFIFKKNESTKKLIRSESLYLLKYSTDKKSMSYAFF